MRCALALFALLGLSACFDADVTLDFKDAEFVEATMETRIVRSMFDMTGDSAEETCDGGIPELTAEHLICRESEMLTIAQLLGEADGTETALEIEDAATIERVDDVTLKVTFDFQDMMEGEEVLPPDMEGMGDMINAMFAGHSMTFRVKGYRIVNTTGTLNEDETEATRVIPLGQLVTQGPEVQTPFVTVVQLEANCVLGIFCD